MGRTPTNKSWQGMIYRCTKKTSRQYSDYGGRGITVCQRWMQFENFYADMGERPIGTSIERINNSLGYSPENCIWGTPFQQGRNKRNNRKITIDGMERCMSEWAEISGTKVFTIFARLKKGWAEKNAVFQPTRKHKQYQSTNR